MTESDADLSRRAFMRTAAGTATAAAATGTASAAESNNSSSAGGNSTSGGNATDGGDSGGGGGGGGPPDLGGYLDGANNYEGSVADKTGSGSVTVKVGAGGGLAFGPAAVHVDNGATVTWEWTGQGGSHNVVSEDDAFKSGDPKSSGTFEHTFEKDGIYPYFCRPHKASGMKGVIVVGTDYPTVDTGGGSAGPSDLPGSAKTLGVATMFVSAASLGFAYFFMKYGGDYGDFE